MALSRLGADHEVNVVGIACTAVSGHSISADHDGPERPGPCIEELGNLPLTLGGVS